MDYQGQKLAERLSLYILCAAAVAAFIAGWISGHFRLTLLTYSAGTLAALIVAVPDWPFYNRHPLHWQEVQPTRSPAVQEPGAGVAKRKARK